MTVRTGIHLLGLILCALVVPLLAAGELGAATRRVALVIGNGDYAEAPDLPNPPNDARDVADALERLDFEVEIALDADIDEMRATLRRFVERLPGADVALFYYAGHGLQYAGENYLIPTNAALEQEADLHFEALGLGLVMNLLEDPARTTLVFLDACRDNPLARSLARSLSPTRSTNVGRGLARVEGGIGTLIAFATAPGDVALDGSGENSPFTDALLDYIDAPGLEVRQMLSRVRDQVYRETDGEQLPWDNSSLRSDFYFQPEPETEPEEAEIAARQPEASSSQSESAARTSNSELAFWEAIQNSRSPREYELFLEQFPESVFAELARTRLAALREDAAPPQEAPAPQAEPEPNRQSPQPVPPPVAIERLDAEFVVTNDANFRAQPNLEGERLGTLPAGLRVTVRGRVEGAPWYQIVRPGGSGTAYVHASLLEEPASASPEPAQAEVGQPQPAPVQPQQAEPEPAQSEPPQSEQAEVAAIAPAQQAEPADAPDEAAPEEEAAPDAAEEPGDSRTETAALVAPRQPATEADPAALATQLVAEWGRGRFRFEDPVYGHCNERTTIDGWSELQPAESAVRLADQDAASAVRARRYSSFDADAELVAIVEPELVTLIEYKHLKANTRDGWCGDNLLESGVFGAVTGRSPYLGQSARVTGMDRHSLGGWFSSFEFIYALTEISGGTGTKSCVAFIGSRRRARIDGFACAAPGATLSKADAEEIISRIRVEDVLD